MENRIVLDKPFSLKKTVLSHGWVKMPPFDWDCQTDTLFRLDMVDGELVRWSVRQESPSVLLVDVEDGKTGNVWLKGLESVVRRCLVLDWCPVEAISIAKKIDERISKYISCGGGRFLRGGTFFEDFYKTVCTINTSWSNTLQMVNLLHNNFGKNCTITPDLIIDNSENDLMKYGKVGYRARVLKSSTERMIDNGIISKKSGNLVKKFDKSELLSFKGIGPYSANHIAILECDYSEIPVDSEVSSYFYEKYNSELCVNDFYRDWGEYRFIGYKIGRIIDKSNWIG